MGGAAWNINTTVRTAVNANKINPDRSQGFILADGGCFLYVSNGLKSIRHIYDLLAET